MLVYTESGSLYEIEGHDVRRLNNTQGSSERVGFDGIWKQALDIREPVVGLSLIIIWDIEPNGDVKTTLTSPVLKIQK